MHAQLFSNEFQKYSCMSYQGPGGKTYSDDRPTTSRKASSLFSELVCDNSGPVGPLAEEATEIWGGHLGNFKIFLLQKLNSYGEP